MWKWLLLVLLLCGGTQYSAASGDGSARPRTQPGGSAAAPPQEKTDEQWESFVNEVAYAVFFVVALVVGIIWLIRVRKQKSD
jgi:hypothetical protein